MSRVPRACRGLPPFMFQKVPLDFLPLFVDKGPVPFNPEINPFALPAKLRDFIGMTPRLFWSLLKPPWFCKDLV